MNSVPDATGNGKRRIPGELGIWIFVLVDMLLFGTLFVLFTLSQADDKATFLHSQSSLHKGLGFANTLLLLTSSWFVALAVEYARRQRWRLASRLLALAMSCGAGFLIVKSLEYASEISLGYSLITDEFFSYYFIVTGMHFLHVVIGLVVLAYLQKSARSAGPHNLIALETGACYWHMVDLLWIAIFALLYLLK